MSVTSRWVVALLWLASLVAVGAVAAAQTRREAGAVIAGDNIGFRPEGWNGKARTERSSSRSTANGWKRRA